MATLCQLEIEFEDALEMVEKTDIQLKTWL